MLFEHEELLDQTAYTQPALFALEVAMAELLLSWGQVPDVVVGHSAGEYAAAVIAGVMGLEAGLGLIAKRGELMGRVLAGGAMEPVLAEFEAYARGVEFRAAERGLVCELTGEVVAGGQVLGAEYWRRHAREAVQFGTSVQTLAELGVGLLVEVGPQAVLLELAAGGWPTGGEPPMKVALLRRGRGEMRQMAEAVAQMYVRGLTVDFGAWDRPWRRRKLALPTYPFQRTRHWVERKKGASTGRSAHRLLGPRQDLASGEIVYASELGYRQQPWLGDHRLYQTVVVPGATYAAMALCGGSLPAQLRDVVFHEPLLFQDDAGRELQLLFSAAGERGEQRFTVHSRARGEDSASWVQHASGLREALEPVAGPDDASTTSVENLRGRMQAWPVEKLFAQYARLELELGPAFRAIRSLWRGPGEALAELVMPDALVRQHDHEPIHPALLDACSQVFGAIPFEAIEGVEEVFYAPMYYGRVTLYEPLPSHFFCHASASPEVSGAAETRTFVLELITAAGRLLGRIENFTVKRAPRKAFLRGVRSEANQLLHRLDWRDQPFQGAPNGFGKGSWLILADTRGIGRRLAEKLKQRQQKCVLVVPGEAYHRLDEESYVVPIDDDVAWRSLLREPLLAGASLQGIVHLWSLDAIPNALTAAGALERDAHVSCGSLLALVRALTKGDGLLDRGLWLVTNGAQSAGSVAVQSPNQSALWGMGRVLQLEHSDLACRLIDLDDPVTESALDELTEELGRPAVENQIAFRGHQRLVPRMLRVAVKDQRPVSFRDNATYLITGGLGGIGLETARWLVARGVRHLVLNGRSAPSEQARMVIAQMQAHGASVEVVRADVSNEAEAGRLLAHIRGSMPPLAGVFHLAGLARDGVLVSQTWPQFQEVIAPKMQGAWNLHKLTADQPLDWFVLFSSAAGLLGNPGQANYAAANAFLDALAHYRRSALGLPAISIEWGAWSEIGLAARRAGALASQFDGTGMGWMTPPQALQALEHALGGNDPCVAALSMDWPAFARRVGRAFVPPLLAELVEFPAKNAPVRSSSRLLGGLRDAPSQEHVARLIEFVGQAVRQVLQIEVPLDAHTEFSELGMDSLMAVDLRNRLQHEFEGHLHLPYALAFQYTNVAALARYLSDQLRAEPSAISGVTGSETSRGNPVDQAVGAQIGRETTARSEDLGVSVSSMGPVRAADGEGHGRAKPPAAVRGQVADSDLDARRRAASSRIPAFGPIAIVGVSGRFPGARDLGSFWQNLADGKSSITEVPPGRWLGEKAGAAGARALDPAYIRWGGFLDGIDEFDAAFFNIARAEAEQIDPQHRLLLQEGWKALEDAGYSQGELAGKACGVFVGIGPSDYYTQLAELHAHTLPGNLGSGLTGRLAYLLDWTGPCLAVDTACASSFSAIHLACASLMRRECDLTLAGGVHIATGPRVFMATAQMGLLSPTGRSRTFDAAADGWVMSEGVGAMVLKRLEDAERDGDHIYGVIRGCGINQDGAKAGFTSPKAAAQTALQRRVYEQAGINPESVDYLEVHGMSTVLGDEIEMFALRESFAAFTSQKRFCAVGSLKPNIGHPFYAAGMASVLKVLLALRHGQIPPLIAPDQVNQGLGFDASPFYLNTTLTEWKRRNERPRRAAINGLSASGANCHLIIDEYVPEPRGVGGSSPGLSPVLLPISARDAAHLRESVSNLLEFLERTPGLRLLDVAFTLQVGRQEMEERVAFTASSLDEARTKLSLFLSGAASAELHRNRVETTAAGAALLVSGDEGKQFLAATIRNRSLDKLARLWTTGVDIDWHLLYQDAQPHRVSLPTYPFSRERYWIPR
ncbi:MAG: SDR family NAD(P)-dependent oxidoreductase [Limisphaerales bacterium]